MKTVGQLLHGERIKRDISIEDLSRGTKIDSKYIEALENDRFDLLPSETFAKGFIRNLATSLGSDPNEFIAVFRRDYRHPETKKTLTEKHRSTKQRLPQITSQYLPIALGVIVFLIYLGFQFRAILTPPPLSLTKPIKGAVLTSPIDIEGNTSPDSLVTINQDNVVKPDQNGNFQLKLNLPVGETILKIKTSNRFSRVTQTEIPITVISN